MLNFDNVKFKENMSELGEKLREEVGIKTNNKFTVKELESESVGEALKRSARYVFEIDGIEGNLLAVLFVNNDYKVKLGVSSMILSVETLNNLSKIVNSFQKIVDIHVKELEEVSAIDIAILNNFLDLAYKIFSDYDKKENDNE